MIRLLILSALGVAIGLFIVKLLSKKQVDDVIDGKVVDEEAKSRPPGVLLVLVLGAMLAGIAFFILPRFGLSVMGLIQKTMAFLPLIRGFFPF